MSEYLKDVIEGAVSDLKGRLLGYASYATINTDTGTGPWTVSVSTHSTALTSSDLPSAYDESDAWFLSLGYKRLSIWDLPGYAPSTCLVSV